MEVQYFDWTCSVCSYAWTLNAIAGIEVIDRISAGKEIGYPNCVNSALGLVDSQCLISAYYNHGIRAFQYWVTFDQAYAICKHYTGVINPLGMYHFMGIRGVDNDRIWVANSAPGYQGIYDIITRDSFNRLGPVQVVLLESYI